LNKSHAGNPAKGTAWSTSVGETLQWALLLIDKSKKDSIL
jgi:hypothetical protein